MFLTRCPSPLGGMILLSDGDALTALYFDGQKHLPPELPAPCKDAETPDVLRQTIRWLDAYFSASPLPAPPPLSPRGTPFQMAVWALLAEIPYGETTTHSRLAEKLRERGVPASPRAVGGAVGRNPISILLPCHRVLGANGSLTGYAGGLERKRYLLDWERTHPLRTDK